MQGRIQDRWVRYGIGAALIALIIGISFIIRPYWPGMRTERGSYLARRGERIRLTRFRDIMTGKPVQLGNDSLIFIFYINNATAKNLQWAKYMSLFAAHEHNPKAGFLLITGGLFPKLNSMRLNREIQLPVVDDHHFHFARAMGLNHQYDAEIVINHNGRVLFFAAEPLFPSDLRELYASHFDLQPLAAVSSRAMAGEFFPDLMVRNLATGQIISTRRLISKQGADFWLFTAGCPVCSLPAFITDLNRIAPASLPIIPIFSVRLPITLLRQEIATAHLKCPIYAAITVMKGFEPSIQSTASSDALSDFVRVSAAGYIEKIQSVRPLSTWALHHYSSGNQRIPLARIIQRIGFQSLKPPADHGAEQIASHPLPTITAKQLTTPYLVACGRLNFYALDDSTGRIAMISRRTQLIRRQFAGLGNGPGQLLHPAALSLHGGKLAVLDAVNHRVEYFSTNGRYVSEFKLPSGYDSHTIALGNHRNVYMNDPRQGTLIQEFNLHGGIVRKFGLLTTAESLYGHPGGPFEAKMRLAANRVWLTAGAHGHIYLSYMVAPVIRKYSAGGQLVLQIAMQGSLAHRLSHLFWSYRVSHGGMSSNMDGVQVPYITKSICIDPKSDHIWVLTARNLFRRNALWELNSQGRQAGIWKLNPTPGDPYNACVTHGTGIVSAFFHSGLYFFHLPVKIHMGRPRPTAKLVRADSVRSKRRNT